MKFSLRALMILVFVSAMICGVFFALPPLWSFFALAVVGTVMPGPIVAGICYGRGYGRAFAIGCAAVAWAPALYHMYMVVMLLAAGGDFDASDLGGEEMTLKIAYAIGFGLIFVSGLLSVGVRWLTVSGERNRGRKRVDQAGPPRPHFVEAGAREGSSQTI